MPCRFNRRRMWTHRIMLEAQQHPYNSFVTLTYSDENIPDLASLVPKHLQDWFKRLRKEIEPSRIRYYAVGEYGDQTWRPHYHIALFGYPACSRGFSQFRRRNSINTCCNNCDLIARTWQYGLVAVGTLEVESAQYVAGYVTKKMTKADDPRLNGRYPEFCRMSLRPGIGADAMHEVANTFLTLDLEQSQADVPSALRHGSRTLPLGRYLRRKLRLMIGKEEGAPQHVIQEQAKEMLPMLEAAVNDPQNPSLKGQILKANKQKALNMEARNKLRRKKHL